TGSFKPRGALNRLQALDQAAGRRGVVAMSAGNHAQGVAYHAQRLGIPATIVMPRGTPFSKIERTEALGARIVLEGESLSEAGVAARRLAEAEGLTFVHPYDDPLVVAGQGTVALEMLADIPDLDDLLVPIGGGGLIAGIAVAAKALKPGIRVFGVQAELYPSMVQALRGDPPRASGPTLAEGIAVKSPGTLTRALIAEWVDDILLVDEAAIEESVLTLIEDCRLVAEGAGAVTLAALARHRARFEGRKVGLVVSGGNIDCRVLASILLRGLTRGGRLARLRVEITDLPGALAKVSQVIAECGGNIIEIYHQRLFHDVPVKLAEIDAMVETTGARHVHLIVERLHAAGFPARVLTNTSDGEG
ncbi:MAG: threonine ammonia-lyase, partial [Alphaproteobacteria bacterium]|nr:threonine ammonia-lyase [Alphaproteobacteria bacterium]